MKCTQTVVTEVVLAIVKEIIIKGHAILFRIKLDSDKYLPTSTRYSVYIF